MKTKDSISRKLFNFINIIFFMLMMATVLLPYMNVLAKALNDGKDTAMGGITIWPREFTWENFRVVLGDVSLVRAFLLTLGLVIINVIGRLLVQYLAAYALLNKRLVGYKAIVAFFLIPMYFGGGTIPTYILYSKIGLLNNIFVYILPGLFSFYNMLIIKSYLSSVSDSLREAAKLDGANDFIIAFRIVMPLSKPVLATVALWTAVEVWSDYGTTLMYVTKKSLFMVQYILMQVLKEAEKIQSIIKEAQLNGIDVNIQMKVTTESVKCAQIMVTTIPIVLVYPFIQKYFITGVTLGATKD